MQRRTIQYLSLALFITLLVWGLYSLIHYLGMTTHTPLLPQRYVERLAILYEDDQVLRRGFAALFTFLRYSFARLDPFMAYIVLSVLFGGGVLAWRVLRGGTSPLNVPWQPWKIIGLFILSLWLLFTTLSVTSSGNQLTFRQIVEPNAQVYAGAGEESLIELERNFARLEQAGCLSFERIFNKEADAGLYSISHRCIQASFFTRVLSQLGFVSLLLFIMLSAGRAVLRRLRAEPDSLLLEAVLSLGIGICVLMALLWSLAVAGIFTQIAGWLLLGVLLLLSFPDAAYWLRKSWRHTWELEEGPLRWVALFLGWFLISYLALNFLTVIRPFPIGWDDLGSYLNRPRLLVSYGTFISSMSAFQWEYLSSLGYLLFGYNSIFGSTAAMIINWSAGLLALLTVYGFGRTFLGKGSGLLAATFYYTLPLIGHFSFADMKTDNAVFTLQALGLLSVLFALFKAAPERRWRWLLLSGLFLAFAFGVKVTSAMMLFTVIAVIVGVELGIVAFIGASLLTFAAFEMQGTLKLSEILERVGWMLSPSFALIALLGAGMALVGYGAYRRRNRLLPAAQGLALLVAAFMVGIAPWIISNNLRAGNPLWSLTLHAPNTLSPIMDYKNRIENPDPDDVVLQLPEELDLDSDHPACVSTAGAEELDRYWGFREGWGHYLTLPWRTVMNADSGGYYVTTSFAFLLFPLLLLVPFFWMKGGRSVRWLFGGTVLLLVQWIFLANGVPWYGIGTLLGLVVGLEALFRLAPDRQNRVVVGGFLGMALLANFGFRMWQFEQQRNLLEYPIGRSSAGVMRERTIPHYDDITEVVLQRFQQMPERPYLYRIGTFMPYFIPQNLEVTGFNDHQLSDFHCLNQEQDHALTLRRLQALGINSIIFDTNTATIERNIQGTLHQKVERFVNFLNDRSLGLQILINDSTNGIVFLLLPEEAPEGDEALAE